MNLEELRDKVINKISEYLEFDIREIFKLSDYITIYGGSVRDSLAEMEINDVDILCMPGSANKLKKFIEEKEYKRYELYDRDTLEMYNGISLISEPLTFLNPNRKIIQIIRPVFKNTVEDYVSSYVSLIKNVDISCCGVFLEFNGKELVLKEACKNAILHSLSKTYEINNWAKLYNNDRTAFRDHKLTGRGWTNLNIDNFYRTNDKFQKVKRRLKLCQLEFQPEVDDKYYKVWYEDEYHKRGYRNYDDYDDYDIDDLPF
jgi:hypothetical protein